MHSGALLGLKDGAPLGLKDGRTPLAAPCMDPGTITLSEMSQTETDRRHMI